MHIAGDPAHSTLSASWKTLTPGETEWTNEVDVEVTTLAELIATYGEPSFCRIDVEGFEDAAVAGLDRAIAGISFEFQCAVLDVVHRALARLLEPGRYRFALTHLEQHDLGSEWSDATDIARKLERTRNADATAYGDVVALRMS